MATIGGSNAVIDGLVFGYDTGSKIKSFLGEPTTNLGMNGNFNTGIDGWYGPNKYPGDDPSPYSTVEWLQPNLIKVIHGGGYSNSQTYIYQPIDLEVGKTYTVSVDCKSLDTEAQLDFNVDGTWCHVKHTGSGEWEKLSYTFTTASNRYIPRLGVYAGYNRNAEAWFKNYQVEEKSYPTPFTPSTRSATESLIDLTGNSEIDTSYSAFDDSGDLIFQTSDIRPLSNLPELNNVTGLTFEFWVKFNNIGGYVIWQNNRILIQAYTQYYRVRLSLDGAFRTTYYINDYPTNGTHQIAVTWDGSVVTTFLNGEVNNIYTEDSIYVKPTTSSTIMTIGQRDDGSYVDGKIPMGKIYNRALSPQEVKRNFNAVRSRFGI